MQNNSEIRIEGFVTHDPKFKTTKNENSVCEFSVAVNHYSKSESTPKVSYFDVETWGKLAEVCSENIHKGRRVLIIGELRQDRWEKEGKIQSRFKLVADKLRFLESSKTIVKAG